MGIPGPEDKQLWLYRDFYGGGGVGMGAGGREDLAKVNRAHPEAPVTFPFCLVFYWEIITDWAVSHAL